jgi:IMP dehydrogenase
MNEQLEQFFAKMAEEHVRLTYGDVRLETDYSEVLPKDTDLTSRFSRRVGLRIPIVSAAMDTVTEYRMAIALASAGGIGVIHKNMLPKDQAKQIDRVKRFLGGMVEDPITVRGDQTLGEILEVRQQKGYTFHSFPVVENGKLAGLLTRNDFDIADQPALLARDAMTPLSSLTTAAPGIVAEEAYATMRQHKKKLLPLVDEFGMVRGLYVFSDLKRVRSGTSKHNVDEQGHLRVAAAVGVGENALTRAPLLADKRCDVFHVDTAHGDSANVFNTIKELKARFPHIDVVAGNVSNGESAKRLADAGADGILVGQGPGSICTTRVIAGIGTPQVSAVYDCVRAVADTDVPVCADGGINNSGDMVVGLALGAGSIMMGRLLAGANEAPGKHHLIDGVRKKEYRGMGSLAAMYDNPESRERYRQTETDLMKLVPEGVESVITATGAVAELLTQYVGGIQAGLGYVGARTVPELAAKARLFRVTSAGLAESHPHDVTIVREPPNYRSGH